jgi:hypothetical protein
MRPTSPRNSFSQGEDCLCEIETWSLGCEEVLFLLGKVLGSVLKNLAKNAAGLDVGEATSVRFVAFVLKTKAGSEESVNCHLPGKEANDFHLVLRSSKTDADECHSVTAEIIPHFRPDAWNKITFQAVGV